MVYGIWYMLYVICYMVYGIWYMVYGIWYMVYVICYMGYGIWYILYGMYIIILFTSLNIKVWSVNTFSKSNYGLRIGPISNKSLSWFAVTVGQLSYGPLPKIYVARSPGKPFTLFNILEGKVYPRINSHTHCYLCKLIKMAC